MHFLLFFLLFFHGLFALAEGSNNRSNFEPTSEQIENLQFSLKDNLKKTKPGDYLVAAQGKNISLLRIAANNGQTLMMEEVSAPFSICKGNWREWAENGAPGNTSWVMYQINLSNGALLSAYSYTRANYFQLPESENFLGTLMTLKLTPIPLSERKKTGRQNVGGSDFTRIWEPKMIYEGKEIPNVLFSAWRTRWPKDGSELSEKFLVIYLPEDQRFPRYFPHWLEISGFVGKAKVRIIDSGELLNIPHHP